MDTRNGIKSYIVREGMAMAGLVEKLAEQYGWSASVPNFSGRLRRDSLRCREAVELADTLGLLQLHTKKVEFVCQEIFAKPTMYNFCELITQSVVIQQGQKKYAYKANFSDAVHICLQFFLGKVSPPVVATLLMRYISPIRPGRKYTRKPTPKPACSFTYRIA